MRLLLLVSVATTFSFAFQVKPAPSQKPTKEIADLVNRLAAAPFEIEADALLMLIDSAKLPTDSVGPTLDRLFVESGRSSIKSPFTGLYPEYSNAESSLPSLTVTASRLGLDQLSLQSRIVSRTKGIKLTHAIELFDSIQLQPPPRLCTDALMPVVDGYYLTLLTLFHDQEKSGNAKIRENAADWLGRRLTVTQEAQIAPVANSLAKLSNQREVFELSFARFSQDLGNLDPSFLPYLQSLGASTDSLILLASRASLSGISTAPLWRAFAAYNRKALTGTRCRAMPAIDLSKKLELVKSKLNSIPLAPEVAEAIANLPTLDPRRYEDAKPSALPFMSDSALKALYIDYATMRFGSEDRRREFIGKSRPDGLTSFIPIEERKSLQWEEQAAKYLRRVEEFAKHNDDDNLTAFAKVGGLYASFIAILPHSSSSFPSALASYVAYLSASPVMKQQPPIWLWNVKGFLRRGTLDEHERGQELVRAMIRQQGSQVLNTVLDADSFNKIYSESNISTIVVP